MLNNQNLSDLMTCCLQRLGMEDRHVLDIYHTERWTGVAVEVNRLDTIKLMRRNQHGNTYNDSPTLNVKDPTCIGLLRTKLGRTHITFLIWIHSVKSYPKPNQSWSQ